MQRWDEVRAVSCQLLCGGFWCTLSGRQCNTLVSKRGSWLLGKKGKEKVLWHEGKIQGAVALVVPCCGVKPRWCGWWLLHEGKQHVIWEKPTCTQVESW